MEPIQALSASVSAANGLKTAAQGIRRASRSFRAYTLADTPWLHYIGDEELAKGLNATQASNIELFLRSERVAPVLSFAALTSMSPSDDYREEILSTLRTAFLSEVDRWCITSGEKWKSAGPHIWAALLEIYAGNLPGLGADDPVAEAIESYSSFLQSSFDTPRGALNEDINKSKLIETYLESLSSLARDTEALVSAAQNAKKIAALIAAGEQPSIINHSDVNTRYSFGDLYVRRSFIDVHTGKVTDSDDLVTARNAFRIILKGSPGSGKSTFVEHLSAALVDPPPGFEPIPSVTVRCREYFRAGWSVSLPEYMAANISASLSIQLGEAELRKIFLTGRILVIIDGLDEITHTQSRSEMVRRIQTFTAQYPPVSILVTTREIGYDQAPFTGPAFSEKKLLEFTRAEVRKYCENWFSVVNRKHQADAFFRESEAIADLRKNPLLLSLLCILYEGNGAIPSDRRGVYSACATLLFHQWDRARQIEQHEAMPKFGNRLMAQIAYQFHVEGTAGSGLGERTLAKVIARYMVGSLGFLQEDAESSAREFLRFCSGRAWLLAPIGPSDNERLFGFTHRTFYEYFLAEALAGAALSNKHGMAAGLFVAEKIIEVYNENATSVVPELLIQCFDFRNDGGSEVYTELCRLRVPVRLLLRLMDGAILSSAALDAGFDRSVRLWTTSQGHDVTQEDFQALLGINGIARKYFAANYLMDSTTDKARLLFLEAWASMHLSCKDVGYAFHWLPIVDELLDRYAVDLEESASPLLGNYLLKRGRSSKPLQKPWDYLVCEGLYGLSLGVISWSIVTVFARGEQLPENGQLEAAIVRLSATINDNFALPDYYLSRLQEALVKTPPDALETSPIDGIDCAAYEKLDDILAFIYVALGSRDRSAELIRKIASRASPEHVEKWLAKKDTIVGTDIDRIRMQKAGGRTNLARRVD
jgi:energy-coupling factor transporter ATP-binding protein EcfA2